VVTDSPRTDTGSARKRVFGQLVWVLGGTAGMVGWMLIRPLRGDITTLAVDAIVNAANSSLLGGGGVDGAIHRAAGPDLVNECRLLGGCDTGEAKATKGHRLPARYVIHTVGPVWQDGSQGEDELLAACYRNSVRVADQLMLNSVAFPAISTGIFAFPRERAARIAVETLKHTSVDNVTEVTLVAHDASTFNLYCRLLAG
jgi:O-acetyl-ADP-ribose deacetylase